MAPQPIRCLWSGDKVYFYSIMSDNDDDNNDDDGDDNDVL